MIFDADGDGAQELYVGNSSGLVWFFDNQLTTTPQFFLISTNALGFDFGSYAAPALADLDADADPDFIVGNSAGVLYQRITRGQVPVTYAAEGSYTAAFTATNTSGDSDTVLVPITVFAAGTPTAQIYADDTYGEAPHTVTFTFGGSDPDGTLVNFALDVESDGTDEISQTDGGSYTHTYALAGTYTATVTVTDDAGNIATTTETITVVPKITTTLTAPGFDPTSGGVATIETAIEGGEGQVTIDIIDRTGEPVRRLISAVTRAPGSYQDSWDGRNDAGQPMGDGVYYVVVTYNLDGEDIVYDAREGFSFQELTPSRGWSNRFNPYEGIPVLVNYTIPWPAETTLYFWTRDRSRPASSIAPVRTVFLRLPRTPGYYVDTWDGFNDQGVAVEAGRQYPVTLWLYRLPVNAIILQGNTPEISAIDIAPRYFNPTYNPYSPDGAKIAELAVNIDKPSSLIVDVRNDEGLAVRRIVAENRAAGPNLVTWDGRNTDGELVAPGTYSIGVVAIDANGNRSLPRYAATTVRY